MREKALMYSIAIVILGAFVVGFVPVVNAEYPDKPIEFTTHGSAGGGSDLFLRSMASILEKEGIIKQTIRVTNRTGGSGAIGMDYIASKKGDPYVIGTISAPPLTAMLRKASIMRYEDITMLASMLVDINILYTKYDAPYNNMQEMIAYAKKSGRELHLGISSLYGVNHIAAYQIGKLSGVPFNLVSFKSGSAQTASLIGGHIDLSINHITEMMGQADAKKVKAIGIVSEKREPHIPDVPTLKEQGIDVTGDSLRGFWAPQDFPPYAVKFWEDAFFKLFNSKAFKDYADTSYAIPEFLTGKALRDLTDKNVANMMKVFNETGAFEKK